MLAAVFVVVSVEALRGTHLKQQACQHRHLWTMCGDGLAFPLCLWLHDSGLLRHANLLSITTFWPLLSS